MRQKVLGLLLAAGAATVGVRSEGALFSSTHAETRSTMNSLFVRTQLSRPDNNGGLGSNFVTSAGITSGSNLVAVTVDTTADTVRYDDIDFLAITMPGSTNMDSTSVNYNILVTPANFPDPAVFMNVSGDYTSRITFNSFSLAGPTFGSSTTSAINYPPTATTFALRSNVTLDIPNVVITGTYEAIGPTNTVSQPFTITYAASSTAARSATSTTPGGPGFGNGFDFTPRSLLISYFPTSSALFDQVVDNVRFAANAPSSLNLQFFDIPEPRCMALAGMALACCAGRRRKG